MTTLDRPRLLVAVGMLCLAAGSVSAAPTPPKYLALAHDTLEELIAIDSVEPHGSTPAVEALAVRFKAGGFAAPDISILAPADHPEKANLFVRLRGRGAGKPVMWMSHLDVVAADPANWSTPPFALTERDGFYYGRGVADMKGEAAEIAAALIRLKQEGFVPDRDITAVFTADEEAAGHVDGVRWMLAAHRPLFDVAFAVNPDTGGGALSAGRRLYYSVQTAEKSYATYTLTVANRGGHSSRPEKDNAIYRLAAGLVRLGGYGFPVRLTATTRAFLNDSAAFEPETLGRDMRALAADQTDAAAAGRLSGRPQFNALIRTTCIATLLSAGEAENALPEHAGATIQCRLLPDDRPDEVMAALKAALADPQIAVAVAKPPLTSPETVPDPQVLAAIGQVVDGMWGHLPVVVGMDTGGSDGVFTRSAGVPTYGAASIFGDIDDNRHHGRDERIAKAAFDDGAEFTYRLMKRLSAGVGHAVTYEGHGL